ncbi:short-subunit dehydrogenase [Lactobacillus colini]|uniref:Short-subunit dehydrogenase n=1 Tax=Lactobacillus colini TaxID=1819254 RepID=A0ABS4MDX0_9LACO|nr:SDR family oxidoreductase [Lactobacillus colini]MBP2057877.1 short-subunit dehydrogenase [Lactobacillus colini]
MTKQVMMVTGASKGIGLETVLAGLRSGYTVVGTSRTPDKLVSKVQKELPDKVANFKAVQMLFTEESINKAISEVIEKLGQIDVLVNNAGYALLGAVEEFSIAEVKTNFDVNFFGLLEVTQAVLPYMRKQKSGRIINMSSISGTVTGPTQGIYSATKAAVIMFSEALADEVKDFNIKVTAVCPWGVRTDFLDNSSMKRPEKVIEDYSLVRRMMNGFENLNHNQSGNPALVGEALIKLAQMAEPPKRIYLGDGAIGALQAKINEVIQETNENIDLSRSIDFD